MADADGDQRSLADPLNEGTAEEPAEEFELVDRRSGKQRSTEWFKAMIGNFIGGSPSPLCGGFRCCMVNTGGGVVVSYDARGHPTKSRRLEIACKLVADGHMDFMVIPECHIEDGDVASCQSFVHGHAGVAMAAAPTTSMTTSYTEGNGEGPSRPQKGPAGALIVMSKAIKDRQRGRARTFDSGRRIHLVFRDGATAAEDVDPINMAAMYGVSAPSGFNVHKKNLAKTLYGDLENLLESTQGQRTVALGDIISFQFRSDRARLVDSTATRARTPCGDS